MKSKNQDSCPWSIRLKQSRQNNLAACSSFNRNRYIWFVRYQYDIEIKSTFINNLIFTYEKNLYHFMLFLFIGKQKRACTKCRYWNNNTFRKLEVAGNIKADTFKYTSPKNFYYSVNEAAFKARNSAETVISGFGTGGASITNGTDNGLIAPVNLPQNAKITQIIIHFYDASATQDLSAILSHEFTSGYGFLATINSSGSDGLNIQNYTFPTPVIVDNSNSSYEILVVPTFQQLVPGIRLISPYGQ